MNYVFKINSPLDATVVISGDELLTIQTYDDAMADGHIQSIDDYKQLFQNSPYYGKLVSKDHRTIGITLSIDKKNDGNDLVRRESVIKDVYAILDDLPEHIDAFISGDAALYYEMDQETKNNLVRLLPLALLLLIVISYVLLRQIRSLAIILIPTLVNLGLVPIVIVLLGHTITIINVTLFVLVLVIAIADGVHMLNYWERYTLQKSKHPIADTIRATWLPCFITSVTTAVGFGSFITSSITPLYEYGLQSFIVMLFSYVFVMTLVPTLLRLIPPKVTSYDDIALFPSLVEKISSMISQHSKSISIIFILVTIIFSQFLWFATTETSFISVFFNKAHQVRQHVKYVDNTLSGSGRIDVILKGRSPELFKDIDVFGFKSTK